MIILTDLSDVLINGFTGIDERISETFLPSYIEQFGKERGEKEVKNLSEWIMGQFEKHNEDYKELLRGHLTEDECWARILGTQPTIIAGVKKAFSANFKLSVPGTLKLYQRIIKYPTRVGLAPGEKATFREGMPEIVIASDHVSERINEVKADHPEVFHVASDQYWSCDLGRVKCDPDFFPKILDDLGCEPDEVLFIDDSRFNVVSAETNEIPSIVFHNATQLETVMRETYGFVFAPEV